MTRPKGPTPPESANPIVVLRASALEEELAYLSAFFKALEKNDHKTAVRLATEALASSLSPKTTAMMVGAADFLLDETTRLADAKNMLCAAVDRGMHEFAYNAANTVMKLAKGVAAYKQAERYFVIAMAYADEPRTQAAAYVNYCPIVRDGLISGEPDWPAAIELYETAARMGLAKAMFNAGNVCSWLAYEGRRDYGKRGADWFNYALEVRASGAKTLDFESAEELETEVYGRCMTALSGLHIDEKFVGASPATGIRWARAALTLDGDVARDNLGIAYTRRLTRMKVPPQGTPGRNWKAVLEQMDWQFQGKPKSLSLRISGFELATTKVERLEVALDDGSTMPLFVTEAACLPMQDGEVVLRTFAQVLSKKHPRFLMLSRKAFFVHLDDCIFTPIHVVQEDTMALQSLWVASTPSMLLEQASAGVDFTDRRFRNTDCALPIQVNALDEGYIAATIRNHYVGVGTPWRMPFVSEANLAEFQILIQR